MKYQAEIQTAIEDPQKLEELYQAARQAGETGAFSDDMLACYENNPDGLLYQAWFYRLQYLSQEIGEQLRRRINWKLAIPISILTGLIFWALSGVEMELLDKLPYLFLLCAPIAAISVTSFLNFSGAGQNKRYALVLTVMVVASLYVLLIIGGQRETYAHDYLILMLIHLPLLAWVGAGYFLIGGKPDAEARFAFLIKSLEVFVTGGVYIIAGGAFTGITMGMFAALGVEVPEVATRLLIAGGGGLIPVLAVASVYDPGQGPTGQDFGQGLSRFVATLMRLLLPLTLVVLVVYLFVIPFNFMAPFQNRDVLIVYNVMLFAIMGLLIGVTPVQPGELSERVQTALRYGILAVAILAVLVSAYALSATIYRAIQGGITINRLAVIGWNGVNIGLLVLLIYRQLRGGPQEWVKSMKSTFSLGAMVYLVWSLFLILAIPLLFR